MKRAIRTRLFFSCQDSWPCPSRRCRRLPAQRLRWAIRSSRSRAVRLPPRWKLPFVSSTPALNVRHEVAFDAILGGPPFTTGVFVGDGKTTSTIALGANPDPAAPSFGTVFNPFITPNGDVVFDVNGSDFFRSDGKTIVPLARRRRSGARRRHVDRDV